MWLLLWHVRWRYEALIWSTTYVMWAAHAWPPDSPWSSYRFIDASCSVAARHGGFLTSVSTAGPLVVFLTRIFRQGFPARSLDSLLFWALVRALDELLIRPFGEAFLCIVLPLWLQFCGLIHLFSAYCGMRAHACHGVLHRPLWPPPCVVCKASASHRDLIPTRAWWVLFGLCAALVPWHAMRVSFGFWMQHRAALALWCVAVRCELDMLYALWWLPHQGVRCQGLLRWLAPVTRVYGLGPICGCCVT
ncbi:hypothetical protein V6N13_083111 [Hibiscus sabdariffa]